MGNCFRRCFEEDSDSEYVRPHGYGGQEAGGAGPIVYTVVGFTAVARDLLEFETTNKVPGALGDYVSASKAMQRIWYGKLLAAWRRANPAPASAEAVAVLIVQTLQGEHGIQGLLRFYHLDWPTVPVTQLVPQWTKPDRAKPEPSGAWLGEPEPEAAGVIKFEIQTLPVKWNENEGDGDGLTVFVDVRKDARETQNLPKEINDAVNSRRKARAQKDFQTESALRKQIEAGNYKVFDGMNGCLARKYKIRLRNVDAPEIDQPFGKEARDILRNLVKDQQLVIHVYGIDDYNRALGDVYCHGKFIQEELLKKGSVWHYKFHDKGEKFGKFEQLERVAQAARLGLWADANPEEPWDYRHRKKKENWKFNNKKKGSFKKKRNV